MDCAEHRYDEQTKPGHEFLTIHLIMILKYIRFVTRRQIELQHAPERTTQNLVHHGQPYDITSKLTIT